MISNEDVAKILRSVSEYLEMQGVAFKPRAYEKVAEVIVSLDEKIGDIYKRGGLKALENIPGVGVSIAEKIEELIKTGRLKYYESLKKKIPVDVHSLTRVEGLGPKRVLKLYKELKIKNLKDLEKAARAGKIGSLEGFGKKSEENILRGIEFLRRSGSRFILGFTELLIKEIESRLRDLRATEKVVVAGSVRRRKETIGDVDILAIAKNPKFVINYFVSMPGVVRVYARGNTKGAVKFKNGLDVDLRVVQKRSYGAALSYFTGSKSHNIALREIAVKKGYKLNEYGLFSAKGGSASGGKGWKQIAGETEEGIYKALGLDYIEPEMREDIGEIELALRGFDRAQSRSKAQGKPGGLPKLIGYGDLKGDCQVQTNWTDGNASIEMMARAAMDEGLKYIAVTDHTKRLAMTGGLDERRIQKQWKEIDAVNKKLRGKFKVLKSTECDILKNGSLDLPDKILSKLDLVGVAVHSYFNLSRREQTERIVRAMQNPYVDILFHPTGRIIQRRDAYEVDMEEIIKTAKRTGTILEIDAYPDRLDLKDEYVRRCVLVGVKMVIDSDAHSPQHIGYLKHGIAQARRGWATKRDIINTKPVDEMLKLLKK